MLPSARYIAAQIGRQASEAMVSTTPTQLRTHLRRSNTLAIAYIVLDYLVIVAAVTAAHLLGHWAVKVTAILVIGTRQVALLNLVHTAAHNALFRTRRLNVSLEWLFAYPILETVSTYRREHNNHHIAIARRSPDRHAYLLDDLRLSARGLVGRTWVVLMRPLLGHGALQLTTGVIRRMRSCPAFALKICSYWCATVAFFAGLSLFSLLVLYWLLPLCIVYPALNLWAEVSDHFNTNAETRNQHGLFYGWVIKPHEMYHATHHRFPAVPFYRLAAATRDLHRSGIQEETVTGMLSFLRCIYSNQGYAR
jgi:fatty acid desaturase